MPFFSFCKEKTHDEKAKHNLGHRSFPHKGMKVKNIGKMNKMSSLVYYPKYSRMAFRVK